MKRLTLIATVLIAGSAWGQAVTVDISEVVSDGGWVVLTPVTNMGQPVIAVEWYTNSGPLIDHGYLHGATNCFTDPYETLTNSPSVLTSTVQRLVKEGLICRVIGHRWKDGCGKLGCLVLHPWPMRHCVVCGVEQSRTLGPWSKP